MCVCAHVGIYIVSPLPHIFSLPMHHKVFVQGGMREDYLRQAYDRAMDGMAEKLLHASNPSKLAYIADWEVSVYM